MELKGDWRDVFAESTSPVALHVRREWLADDSAGLRRQRGRQLDLLLEGRRPDGSFEGAVAETIVRLHRLWLVGCEPDETVRNALDWLLEKAHPPLKYISGDGAP